MDSSKERLQKPGFGLPLACYDPFFAPGRGSDRHALTKSTSCGSLVRERSMCEAVDRLSDKPDWRRKVFDEAIAAQWRSEAFNDVKQGFSHAMFDFCLAELRDKARQHEETGVIRLYEIGPAVAKSDTIVTENLRCDLMSNVAKLPEDVPTGNKDWHPGSDEQVLDLVHPSLYPLVYGLTKVEPFDKVDVLECLSAISKGEITAVPGTDELSVDTWSKKVLPRYSTRFQWLPAEIHFDDKGCKINSYINNLHPTRHKALYPVIEQVIDKAIPLWNEVLSNTNHDGSESLRFVQRQAEYEEFVGMKFGDKAAAAAHWHAKELENLSKLSERPGDGEHGLSAESIERQKAQIQSHAKTYWFDRDGGQDDVDEDEDEEEEDDYYSTWRRLIPPEPKSYNKHKEAILERKKISLREMYFDQGLQVIVKLANIHLTPDRPEYAGGSWHVEGMLNEMICATAIYYYDCENITDSYLAFRHRIDHDELYYDGPHGQDDYGGLEAIFGIDSDEAPVQEIGRVLTREGRLLAFPNVMQHKVSPFSLADRTKPGHRKILALFLVDPECRILSTANVPPQRKDWWKEELQRVQSLDRAPVEIQKMILDRVEDFPYDLDRAKELRLELMAERSNYVEYVDKEVINEGTFNFCEH